MKLERRTGIITENPTTAELKRRLYITEHPPYASLDLGQRRGITSGYPRLTFSRSKWDGEPYIVAYQPNPHDPDHYEQHRPVTVDELLILIRTAKAAAPDHPTTAALTTEATRLLIQRKEELDEQLKEVSAAISEITR